MESADITQCCVIVGAGHAGTNLAFQLRREGWSGGIQLINAESELPYHRPPLSKDVLAGAKSLDNIRLRPQQQYVDNDIELLSETVVKEINRKDKFLSLGNGDSITYDQLTLCTGSRLRLMPESESYDNVFYLRNAEDSVRLSSEISAGKHALIIGAGYIGLETAAVLNAAGLKVTVLEMAERPLARVASEALSSYLTQLHNSHGVTLKTSVTVEKFVGHQRIEEIVLSSGELLRADIVIVGIGIEPCTELAEQAGLEVDNGIVVDEFACTSDPAIYAAGDCTYHPSLIYQRRLRLESVQNATDQARVVAANLCGKATSYNAVPWFWSDQFDVKLQTVGLLAGFDQMAVRGTPAPGGQEGFALYYLEQGKIIAADCVGRPKEFMVAKQLVQQQRSVAIDRLNDDSLEPAQLLD